MTVGKSFGRSCKVNLNRLFEVSPLKMARGLAVKPNETFEKIPTNQAVSQTALTNQAANCSQKICRITKIPSKLTEDFVCNTQPSGSCPGCRSYVNKGEKGVVCEQCKAYWHYGCANVTQEQVDLLGKDEFVCESHRKSSDQSLVPTMIIGTAGERTQDEEDILSSVIIKTNPYSLDKLSKVKFKLNNIDKVVKIEPKACKRQHTVKVNSVTYQIIMMNLHTKFQSCVRRYDNQKGRQR